MIRAPKPETVRALLESSGVTTPTITMHEFIEARPCVISGPGGGAAWEYIFRCQDTGMERRWGTCDRIEGTEN